MSNFTPTAIQRNFIALFAALVFSTACIGAAVGPAHAGAIERVQVTA